MGIIFSLFRRLFTRMVSNPVDQTMSFDDQIQGPPTPLNLYQLDVDQLDDLDIGGEIPEPDPDHANFDPDDEDDFVPPGCHPRNSFFRNGFGSN